MKAAENKDAGLSQRVKEMIDSDQYWDMNNYEDFVRSLNNNEKKAFLTPYTAQEFQDGNIQTFKLKNYNIGFALHDVGEGNVDIISVHNSEPRIGGIVNNLMNAAKRHGGNQLDHFEGVLSDFYSQNGFEEYDRWKWDDQYAPQDWDYEKYGRPDVVLRRLNKGNAQKPITAQENRNFDVYCQKTLEECKQVKAKEIKHFHPENKKIPNGIGLQRGGYFKECKDNFESFILNEDIHGEQYGLRDWRGGIIVFATSVNAVELDKNAFLNKVKQAIVTFRNNVSRKPMLRKIIDRFNKNRQTDDFIGAYSLGNAFSGKYIGDNGEHFDDTSFTIEVNGLSSEGLMLLASYIARVFKQETVLVKDLNKNKIFLANGYNTGNNDYDSVNQKC